MNYEELKNFREDVAAPTLQRIFDNTEIPEGTVCINNMIISFLDGRNCGHESRIEASGLLFRNGRVEKYEYDELDLEPSEFFNVHKDCTFISDGRIRVKDDLTEMDLSTRIYNLRECGKLFPQLANAPQIYPELQSIVFEKMKYLLKAQENMPDRTNAGHGFNAPSRGEVEAYFSRNGRPDPETDWIENFMYHPKESRREQHWEAIANDYELCDFDRWQHLQDVMGLACSWGTFRSCNSELWEQDIEILDLEKGDSDLRAWMEENLDQLQLFPSDRVRFPDDNIWICAYKDTLGIQDDHDNLTDILVPTEWLFKMVRLDGYDPNDWFEWFTADNTEDIARTALKEGLILDCADPAVKAAILGKAPSLEDRISNAASRAGKSTASKGPEKDYCF